MFDHCPRCGEALKPGFLRSGGHILWTPSGKWRLSYLPGEEEIPLEPTSYWSGAKRPAQYCGNCGLILVETKEEGSI